MLRNNPGQNDKIYVKEGILPDRQHLLLDSKQLEESRFLREYNTQNKSIPHLEALTEDAGSKKKWILHFELKKSNHKRTSAETSNSGHKYYLETSKMWLKGTTPIMTLFPSKNGDQVYFKLTNFLK